MIAYSFRNARIQQTSNTSSLIYDIENIDDTKHVALPVVLAAKVKVDCFDCKIDKKGHNDPEPG